jgi:hypothetical protein
MILQKKAPTALIVIAVLFIVSGIYHVFDVMVLFTHSKLSLSSGVLGVFVGPGLLRFRPGWRICALVFTWLGLIFTPVFALIALNSGRNIPVIYFDHTFGFMSQALSLVVAFIYFVFFVWQYRVLTSENVVRLFYD